MTTITESQDAPVPEPIVASSKNSTDTSHPVSVENPTSTVGENDQPQPQPQPQLKESEFSRASIEELGNRIRLTDKDESTGLELFCYVKCNPHDNSLIRQCRGVVFHNEELVMRAFPYTTEYSHTDTEEIEKNIQSVFRGCTFYDAHEGALIRMFFFAGRWFTSTHRKLNAFRSKWASRESFGTAFKRALEAEMDHNSVLKKAIPAGEDGLLDRFQSTLDKTKQYMFLVRHSPDNRIVCAAPKRPTVYHVGTFIEGKLVMTENIHIPYPRKHTFLSMDGLISQVVSTEIRDLQGIICFAPDNKQYKVMHKEYLDLFRARGNEPSIKFRYLQVRMNRRYVNMLYHLYPEMELVFNDIENTLYDIAKNIYTAYVQRFIKKRFVTVPSEDYAIIRTCHKWHEEDRAVNRISIEKVINVMNQQSPTALNRMLRRFRAEKREKEEETKKSLQQRARTNTMSSNSSPALSATIQSSPVISPLLLTKDPRRNPALPVIAPLGAPAIPLTDETRTRVLSKNNTV